MSMEAKCSSMSSQVAMAPAHRGWGPMERAALGRGRGCLWGTHVGSTVTKSSVQGQRAGMAKTLGCNVQRGWGRGQGRCAADLSVRDFLSF